METNKMRKRKRNNEETAQTYPSFWRVSNDANSLRMDKIYIKDNAKKLHETRLLGSTALGSHNPQNVYDTVHDLHVCTHKHV